MKSWMTSVAMYMAILGVVVIVILAMSGLALLTWLIIVSVQNDEITRDWLILLGSIWLALASCFAGGVTLAFGKGHPWRRGALAGSATGLLLAVYLQGSREYRPIDTADAARPMLEFLINQQVRSSPDEIRVVDLGRQIRNIRILGPRMSFDPSTARYIEFEFDTGCGEVINLTAMTGTPEGTELWGLANEDYCAR
ncbi:hypothetical protein [Sinorhizobium chiapasense]|uniref:Uncharacterized protein n=1 Tax=Sinorhizobium chiapasense TaxID=501572 RepID=A0ABZ2B3A8_9HYPH